jgi:hypothetical protein
MKKKTKTLLFWGLQISGWSIYALMMFFLFSKTKPEDFLSKFLFLWSYLLGFIVTSFGLRYLFRFYKKRIKSMARLLPVVFFSVLFIVPIWYFIDVYTSMFFWNDDYIEKYLQNFSLLFYFRYTFQMHIVYFGWTALYFGIKYWVDWQEEKQRSVEAYHMAQKAQLQMLRYQLNPHFLFNSLNSIKALVEEDKTSAKEMITDLSDFLRYSLMDKDIAFRPLQEELNVLKLYLSIEKKRFEEKLQVLYDITEEAKGKQVLSFLLHPIIENAIKYGMKSSELPLKILIRAYLKDGYLVIELCNSGKWLDWGEAEGYHGTGTGLENVKNRLKNAYPDRHRFEILKSDTNVCIKIELKSDEQTS